MPWYRRMQNLDPRFLYIFVLLSVAIPLLKPVGLPIDIVQATRDCYAAVDKIPAGEVLVLSADYSSTNATEMNPMVTSVFTHCMRKGVKVLLFSRQPEGCSLAHPLVEKIANDMGKKYGVDWTDLGYKPGNVVTLKKFVDDIWGAAANVDFYNTPLSNIPMMQNLKAMAQCKLIVSISGVAPGASDHLTYIGVPGNVPVTGGTTSVSVPEEVPYVKSGQYKGFLYGLKGAAEYELLLDNPGNAVAGMDAQSMAHLLIIALIVIANIGYFAEKADPLAARKR